MFMIHAHKIQRGFNSRVTLLDGSEAQAQAQFQAQAQASYVADFFLVCYMPLADLNLFPKQSLVRGCAVAFTTCTPRRRTAAAKTPLLQAVLLAVDAVDAPAKSHHCRATLSTPSTRRSSKDRPLLRTPTGVTCAQRRRTRRRRCSRRPAAACGSRTCASS